MNLDEFRQYVTAQRKESMAQALTALTAKMEKIEWISVCEDGCQDDSEACMVCCEENEYAGYYLQ